MVYMYYDYSVDGIVLEILLRLLMTFLPVDYTGVITALDIIMIAGI